MAAVVRYGFLEAVLRMLPAWWRRLRLRKKILVMLTLLVLIVPVLLIAAVNTWVILSVDQRIYQDLDEIPANDYALVLGTSHLMVNGQPNPFFDHRIEAAAALYNAGKARYLVLSGHSEPHYNEPAVMAQRLAALGVPETALIRDGEGHRTIDSIQRVKSHDNRVTIVSQSDHIYRALFLARHAGIDAVAYPAEAAPPLNTLRVGVREVGARVKAVIDLYLPIAEPNEPDSSTGIAVE